MSSKTIWDAHGNRIGEDVITTDRDGLTHIAYYDNHNSLVGCSYETRHHKGIGPFAYRWILGKKKEKINPEHNPHRSYDLPLWQCPSCGKRIFTAGRFCPDCGTEKPEQPAFFAVSCPHCSKPIQIVMGQGKRGVCSECGHSYDFEQE